MILFINFDFNHQILYPGLFYQIKSLRLPNLAALPCMINKEKSKENRIIGNWAARRLSPNPKRNRHTLAGQQIEIQSEQTLL